MAILGGAKVSDKIEVVENLMKIADAMLIGGGMAYTFLKSQGLAVGKSLVEADKLDLARRVMEDAKQRNFRLLLPSDHVLGAEFKADTQDANAPVEADSRRLDGAGHRAAKRSQQFAAEIARAKTIVWNGPMGVFEMPAFANGTLEMAHAVAAATARWGDLHCRRRRFGGGGASGGRGGQDFAHFDGRWRIAGVSGGPEAARRRGADG